MAASAVAFSALLALSLSPMLGSVLLRPARTGGPMTRGVNAAMDALKRDLATVKLQRATQRKADAASRKRRKPKAAAAQETRPITDLPVFYAEMVNSDRYVPVSAISNSMRDAMLARGLVTSERLRERGIR